MAGARTHSAKSLIDVFPEASVQQWGVWWDVLADPVLWKKIINIFVVGPPYSVLRTYMAEKL